MSANISPHGAKHPTLVLVRHGETEGESSIRYHGRTDVPLSEVGRRQMRAVRDVPVTGTKWSDFVHVFATPLSRARESAQIVAGHDCVVAIEDFREVDFGWFEGLTADEIRERHPAEFERWTRDKFLPSYAYPGGESRAAFERRVARGVERMFELWTPGSLDGANSALLVAHRGVIRRVARILAAAEPVVELGSIQILEHDGRWRARALDLTDHLANI
ncbi:MAG: histidine phosphatase family protein [Candidatus Binataceae bacterium]